MKRYEFKRSDFKWAEEYYEIIKERMNLPEWFGKNADALWDMLTGFIETPCEIVLIGFNNNENEYNQKTIELINGCFKDAAKQFPKQFKVVEVD